MKVLFRPLRYLLVMTYCVKSVQIRCFFWSVFSRIQYKYGKIRTRQSCIFGHFSRNDSIIFCNVYLYESNHKLYSKILNYVKEKKDPGKVNIKNLPVTLFNKQSSLSHFCCLKQFRYFSLVMIEMKVVWLIALLSSFPS